MKFETGSLVTFRGRDWTVLPPLHEDALLLKPLGGLDAEIVEISPELETVSSATFALPDPNAVGDSTSCALLRDAVRLGLRSTTGPFRSFGHIAVEPRPYQLVPLLMAMKQETVRLLIADDVGIGKTVESLFIARELYDRGEIRRMTVLCPPPLAEQWQKEMADKFHLEANLVLPSTVARLERGLGAGTSLFEKYPFTIVSLDFIKSDRHRLDFIRACPEFVIVDEAHACASSSGGRGKKQRYDLVRELAQNPKRHMLFVTATPHSGKEDVFRSLLAFLNPDFADLPEDLTGRENEQARRRLAEYFVQRRRGDILAYMDTKTPFPVRKSQELTWSADKDWEELFNQSLALARDNIESRKGDVRAERIGWWSALALLRAVSSSPEAAAQTLKNRAQGADGDESEDLIDALGSQAIYDRDTSDETDIMDSLPGSDASSEKWPASPANSRYTALARVAKSLMGAKDRKLQGLVPHLKKLLDDGFSPILFCRFIATARYLAKELHKAFPKCDIECVTSLLPPAEREARVLELSQKDKRILVCTDCLSEGINLQENFNAVVHYDLSWNPTRHEQREGRVDRFGQSMKEIRVITWWGKDNSMDGMVLNVLLRKHESIRKSLGVSVPVPEDAEKVMETLLRGLLLRQSPKKREHAAMPSLPGVEDHVAQQEQQKLQLASEWDAVAKKEEKRSRTLFAHATIKTDEVARCLAEACEAAGNALTVERFVRKAYPLLGGVEQMKTRDNQTTVQFSFDDLTRSRVRGLELPDNKAILVFDLPAKRGQTYLSRTHPLVEQLASWLAETALDPVSNHVLARCGTMSTRSVSTRTTLLLCRFRFLLSTTGVHEHTSLAEECALLAFEDSPQNAVWLADKDVSRLLSAEPDGNVGRPQAQHFIARVEEGIASILPHVEEYQKSRAEHLLQTHRAVRDAAKWNKGQHRVQAQGKPDILGIFVYLPFLG